MAKAALPFVAMQSDLLNKEIKSIGVAGHKLNTRIQIAALNAIWYSIKHGDVGFGQRLVAAMNKGQRKNTLIKFLEIHGKFQWNHEQKTVVFIKRDDLDADKVGEIVDQWVDAVKEPEINSVYDFEKIAGQFIKKMEKAFQDTTGTVEHGELFDYMKSAYDQYMHDQIKAELQTEVEEEVINETGRKELMAA